MNGRKQCIRCGRTIDAVARICPYCNWDQSNTTVPRTGQPAVPPAPPSEERSLRKYMLMGIGAVGLLIVAFALGSLVHGGTPPPAPGETAATNTTPVPPPPRPQITLVPTTGTTASEPAPITSAPAATTTEGVPNEMQRNDATAASSAEYAQLEARAQAEKKKATAAAPPPQSEISSSTEPAPPPETASTPAPASKRVTRTAPIPEYQPMPDVQVSETTTLRIELTIGADGRVKEIDVGEGIPGQTAKIVEVVQTWRFKPATENGVPVPSTFSTALSFHGNQ